MNTDPSGLRDALRQHGMVAILRAQREAPLLDVMRVLVGAGVRCLEVTVPTPGSLAAISQAVTEFGPEVLVGAGTVTTPDQVDRAAEAGARFVVSPTVDPAVITAARASGLGSLPGALTPTEILTAWQCGPSAVKLFPAGSLGSRFVSDLAGPMPEIPVVPTGGIGYTDVPAYLDAGALAVGVGTPLLDDTLTGGCLHRLRTRALLFVAEARARGGSRI